MSNSNNSVFFSDKVNTKTIFFLPGSRGVKGEAGICPVDCVVTSERISRVEMDLQG